MARVQAMVQLSDEIIRLLDDEAERVGVSRSALIREAVEAYLGSTRERILTEQLIDGYVAIPQGATDEWGSVQEQAHAASRRTLQRLDAEEEAAGASW